jgi:hypothetical protein
VGEELGSINFSVHLRELYAAGVVLTPDHRLSRIETVDGGLRAVLRNEYTEAEMPRDVDHVVVEYGTLPLDDVYFALRPGSTNRGEVDWDALVEGRPQAIHTHPGGTYQLFRIGDAVASRNAHAAIYDALRLCKDL